MSIAVGSRLGHYEVTAKIGEGGMGQVYQATDTKLNRQVALKILPEAFASDPDRLARFQREAQVLASLNHPGGGGDHRRYRPGLGHACGCFRHQLLLSRPYLLLAKAFTPDFRNERSCQRYNRL